MSAVDAFIGGFFGPSYAVRSVDGATAVWEGHESGQDGPRNAAEVEVGPEGWEAFWEAVEASGAWDWRTDYEASGITDGTSWSVTLEHGGRRVVTSGSNAAPQGFAVLQRALESLVEGRRWR